MSNKKPKRILIVEDDEFMVKILTRELTQAGFMDLTVATNSDEVISEFKKQRPDVIILDILLPGRSGLEALKDVRGLEDGKKVHVFILTNYGNPEYREFAARLGVKEYLIKSNTLVSDLVQKMKALDS